MTPLLLRHLTTSLHHLSSPTRRLVRTIMAKTKLDTAEFRSLLTPELLTLSELFTKHGHEIRIAGGAVRDLLGGKVPHDIDFATTATPDQMKEMFTKEGVRMINAKGEEHGTITARILDKENYEVTTLRIDKVTDGRRAEVEFTKDWQVDANRRDLTVNSMFLDLQGELTDYFGGKEDLEQRRVRFVGEAETRIQEDYLRILRYFRFYGRLAPQADCHCPDTMGAIRDNVGGMARVSGERIWTEWAKILAGNHGGELTRDMVQVGLGPYIGLPEDPNTEELMRVWRQSETRGVRLLPMALLVALLRSEEEVLKLHGRLKLSCVERDLGLFIVQNRNLEQDDARPLRPYQWLAVDSRAKAADTRTFISQLMLYRGEAELLAPFQEWEVPRFPVKGDQLKEAGCPPGRLMSVVIARLRALWKEGDFLTPVEELVAEVPAILETIDLAELDRERGKHQGGPRLSSKERKRLRKDSR